MINAGVGVQQINNILAELNVPPVHHTTIKKSEREIGTSFEAVSQNSCDQAIEEELTALNQNER